MAVYFPRNQQSLSDIKKKLTDDLASAAEYTPHGVVFVMNQELRLSERRDLEKLGGQIRVELFHLERITTILDQPGMGSLLQQFLGIGPSQPSAPHPDPLVRVAQGVCQVQCHFLAKIAGTSEYSVKRCRVAFNPYGDPAVFMARLLRILQRAQRANEVLQWTTPAARR